MKTIIKNIISVNYEMYLIISAIYHRCIRYARNIISIPLLFCKIKNNKILISNYYGRGYGDNGKYIAEEIIKKGLDYDIVWLLRKELIGKAEFPSGIRIVEYGSLRGLYELATAKIWIDNCRKTFYPIKRKKRFYIQTWHGGIALKKVEKDVEDKLSPLYIMYAKKDSKMVDLMISNSEFCTKMYRNAFWYDNEILEIGSPRCDIFFSEKLSIIKKVKKYYGINEENKILLYAPTFRKNQNTDIYNIDFNKLLKILGKKFKSKWVILVRLHPNISEKSNFMEYSTNIINATDYGDMYELLAASNILITDYSSTMFEFSFMKKPVFLYTPDLDNYKNDRNFYFNIDDLPYAISKDNNQLHTHIENYNEIEYLSKLETFLTQLNIFENGQAASSLVKRIRQIN